MSANSYGIIVEGKYDSAVYEAIIQRLTSQEVPIKALEVGGKVSLMRKFPGLLRAFEHILDGGPVEMAVVIQDADGKDADEIEAEMRAKIEGRTFPFRLGVQVFVVRQAVEAWLLADERAVSAVTLRRNGKQVTKPHHRPEELLDPKETIREVLTDSRVIYTSEVGREIAREIDFQVLSNKCPRFRVFSQLVDC